MKPITDLMIRHFDLKDRDFMGYRFNKNNASYHHLIIPKRLNGPETLTNGAILNSKTSHPYLHIIENVDSDMFYFITSEMIDMNIKGYLDLDNLRRIDDVLCQFEKEHYSDTTKKGKKLIKDIYISGRK